MCTKPQKVEKRLVTDNRFYISLLFLFDQCTQYTFPDNDFNYTASFSYLDKQHATIFHNTCNVY